MSVHVVLLFDPDNASERNGSVWKAIAGVSRYNLARDLFDRAARCSKCHLIAWVEVLPPGDVLLRAANVPYGSVVDVTSIGDCLHHGNLAYVARNALDNYSAIEEDAKHESDG